jgi:hypothetical protein
MDKKPLAHLPYPRRVEEEEPWKRDKRTRKRLEESHKAYQRAEEERGFFKEDPPAWEVYTDPNVAVRKAEEAIERMRRNG